VNKKSDLSKTKLYNPLQINESNLSTLARSTLKFSQIGVKTFVKKQQKQIIMQPKLLLYHFYDDSR